MWKLAAVFLLVCLISRPLHAQEPDGQRLLTDSINPESGMVTIAWLDLITEEIKPITSFNETSFCLPEMAGGQLLYEPDVPNQTPYVYQIDLVSGAILPFPGAEENGLRCPTVNPNGTTIAWLKSTETTRQLYMTGMDASEPILFSEAPDIYDVMWSPDGEILIYTATEDDETFRTLYSHNQAKTSFWQRDQGLVIDYIWLPDSSGLLVAYYTQETAIIGLLSRECVLSGNCQATPLALFGLDSNLVLTDAFSPDQQAMLVLEEISDSSGSLRSDLYSINVQSGGATRLTDSPHLIKNSPVWMPDNQIYFIGSLFSETSFTFVRSAIYKMLPDTIPEIAYQAEGYYPAHIIGWETP